MLSSLQSTNFGSAYVKVRIPNQKPKVLPLSQEQERSALDHFLYLAQSGNTKGLSLTRPEKTAVARYTFADGSRTFTVINDTKDYRNNDAFNQLSTLLKPKAE